jgi:hypothetical protein
LGSRAGVMLETKSIIMNKRVLLGEISKNIFLHSFMSRDNDMRHERARLSRNEHQYHL